MTGRQKTAKDHKQLRLEQALRANLMRRKTQAAARDKKPPEGKKQPDESVTKR